MIFNVIGLLIGIAVLLAGLFYMVKEKTTRNPERFI